MTLHAPTCRALAAAATLALTGAAQAHITLEQAQAAAGSTYKAVFRVGHGCSGSPTQRLTVALPAGFRGARPMPKAGWALAIRRAPLAQPVDSHGQRITDDVVEISWQARSPDDALPEAQYDEFVLRGQLPEQAGPLWFSVRQTCAQGEWHWAERPADPATTSTRGLRAPAVLLQVVPAEGAHHAH